MRSIQPKSAALTTATTRLIAVSPLPRPLAAAVQATDHVSPSGNDADPGRESNAFRTITTARDVVRTVNGSMTGDIVVTLRDGTYVLPSPIAFTPADGGKVRVRGHQDQTDSPGCRLHGPAHGNRPRRRDHQAAPGPRRDVPFRTDGHPGPPLGTADGLGRVLRIHTQQGRPVAQAAVGGTTSTTLSFDLADDPPGLHIVSLDAPDVSKPTAVAKVR